FKSMAQTAISLMARDWQRNLQLTDTLAPIQSMTIQAGNLDFNGSKKSLGKKPSKIKLDLLPLGLTLQNNSALPYGWNDGSMIPVKGLQTQVTGGFKFSVGKFSIQLQPEFVYAANEAFEGFPTKQDNFIWARHYKYLNQSDIPERFGTAPYQKFFAGQSSIRYSTNQWSIGISTENMWWGPGRKNALVMSYNAPGFLHYTFNSVKPLKTKIGHFEWQLMGGQLENSGMIPAETNRVYNGQFLYQPKKLEGRYIVGAILNWQPKWMPGLFMGATRVSYLYQSDATSMADYLPLDGIITTTSAKAGKKANFGSLFARYLMPKVHTEFYFEYGRNDKAPGIWNTIADNHYAKAYVFGLRKLFPIGIKGQSILFGLELTQMQLDEPSLILDSTSYSWYTHPQVRHGYTHQGQVIGAGIGPGSNSQTAEIAWIKGKKKIGLEFERVVRNNDFYYYAYQPSGDYNRHWVDIATKLNLQWDFKGFFISAHVGAIRSINYQWFLNPTNISYFKGGWDLLNLNGQLSINYTFK
ncbi:MAG: capsule assembly Wzi family protein, partial [Sediminibacterium sp.]